MALGIREVGAPCRRVRGGRRSTLFFGLARSELLLLAPDQSQKLTQRPIRPALIVSSSRSLLPPLSMHPLYTLSRLERSHSSGLHGHHLDPLVVCDHARQLELGGGQRVCRLHRPVPAAKGMARQAGRRGARRGARRRPRAATTGGRAAASPAACRFRVTRRGQRWAGQRTRRTCGLGSVGICTFPTTCVETLVRPHGKLLGCLPSPLLAPFLLCTLLFSTCALSYTCLLCHAGVSVLLWPPASVRLYYVP